MQGINNISFEEKLGDYQLQPRNLGGFCDLEKLEIIKETINTFTSLKILYGPRYYE